MIDYQARKQMVRLINKLTAGHPINIQFEHVKCSSKFTGLLTFLSSEIWPFYDDLYSHKLRGQYKEVAHSEALVTRMVLFLYGDAQYKWPIIKKRFDVGFILLMVGGLVLLKFSIPYWILSVMLLLVIWIEFKKIWWKILAKRAEGDISVWPFLTQQELHYALVNNPSTY